jgi:hypothetical protein
LFQLPAALLSTFCLWNSAPPLSIDLLTAFDHVDTRFTLLSCHVYNILDVRVVHCRHSGGNCLALSAWVSARSFRGSPRGALTLTMNVCAPRIILSLTHSMIVFMMSAFASPASVVRGPLPIYLDTLSRVVSLSHRYSRSTSGGVAWSVRATAANLAVVSWLLTLLSLLSLTCASSLPVLALDDAQLGILGKGLENLMLRLAGRLGGCATGSKICMSPNGKLIVTRTEFSVHSNAQVIAATRH